MQEVINTAEDLVFVIKRDVKEVVNNVNHIRNVEDIGLKTMAKLHGILMDCKTMLQTADRFLNRVMDVEVVRLEYRRFTVWLEETKNKVVEILELDKVITVADCEALEQQEPWYQPIMNTKSMCGGLLTVLAVAVVITIISNLVRILA